MADVTCITPSITGGFAAIGAVAVTAGTVYIKPSTAQSVIDFNKLVVRFQSTVSTANSIQPLKGDDFTGVNVSNGSAITIGTVGSALAVAVIGGTYFESARFKDSDGYAAFEVVSSHTLYVEAFLLP